jgi:hypothetical protein
MIGIGVLSFLSVGSFQPRGLTKGQVRPGGFFSRVTENPARLPCIHTTHSFFSPWVRCVANALTDFSAVCTKKIIR